MIRTSRLFLQPQTSKHRQYEALRACFVERLAVPEAAQRFGYTPGTLHVMCSRFRQHPSLEPFFPSPDTLPPKPGPVPRRLALLDKIVALRKQNQSVYDIAAALQHAGTPLTPAMIGRLLREQGFAKLPVHPESSCLRRRERLSWRHESKSIVSCLWGAGRLRVCLHQISSWEYRIYPGCEKRAAGLSDLPQQASGSQRQAVSPHSDRADWIQAGDSEDGGALL